MNIPPQKFIFVSIGAMILLVLIINHGLNRELKSTIKKTTPVFLEEKKKVPLLPQPVYDPAADYAPSPSKEGVKEEVFEIKKTERVLDKKIIYEMPTSNKYLLQ